MAHWLLLLGVAALVVYGIFVAGLVLALLVGGRREEARALAGFVPDCAILCRRLLHDPRVPRARKLALAALVAYLVLPFDLVPDFIPVAGQLDDAVVVALTLRAILRRGGREMIEEHWPGPRSSLALILRVAGPAKS